MNKKELFIKAIETLLNAWGHDTPPEVIWGVNELLEWYEKEYNVSFNRFLQEDCDNEKIWNDIVFIIRK